MEMDSAGRQQYRQTIESLTNLTQISGQPKMSERRRSSIFPAFLRSGNNHPRESVGTDSIYLESYIPNEPNPCPALYEKSSNGKKQRPTVDELSQPSHKNKQSSIKPSEEKVAQGYKLGWINGVWIRTLLNIWGVELFLRMGWMVGQSGLIVGVLQIVLSTAISLVTALSMSAICTNGKIETGGTYYMISRSLGVEAGAMIGTITYFSMCVLNSLNIVGAAEGVIHIIHTPIIDGDINDIRLVSIVLLIIIAVIPLFGMGWEAKTHWAMFVVLVAALLDYFVGTVYDITPQKQEHGLTGWNMTVIKANLWPDYQYGEDFYSVIAVFFPMVTGIFAGSGMSGDLRDPSKAIPRGTIGSILTSSASYMMVVIFLGCSYIRYGDQNGNQYLNYEDICKNAANCPNGLVNDYHTMTVTSIHPWLINTGIFVSAISSSLAVYVAAPRMFQAFSRDRLFPYVEWFGKGHGPNNEPFRGYMITFMISLIFCLVGRLNAIAPIISTFKLASFFLVNITCFHASYINSPSFRPSFRYYNKWLSLLVGLFCLVFMFFLHWDSAIVTIILSIIIFVLVNKRSPKVNWGSTTEDQVYMQALNGLYRLLQIPDHVKNYRPKIWLLCGNPSARKPLIDFAKSIYRSGGNNVGPLVATQIGRDVPILPESQRLRVVDTMTKWLKESYSHPPFYVYCEAESLAVGTKRLIQLSGIGKMKPNLIMMGFKQDWRQANERDLIDYFDTISVAFEMYTSIAILRSPNGFDFTNYLCQESSAKYSIDLSQSKPIANGNLYELNRSTHSGEVENRGFEPDFDVSSPLPPLFQQIDLNGNCSVSTFPAESNAVVVDVDTDDDVFVDSKNNSTDVKCVSSNRDPVQWSAFALFQPDTAKTPDSIVNELKRFSTEQPKGKIDVWWIHDDGGLTLLLPYLLSQHHKWKKCSLRVFTWYPKDTNYDQDQLVKLLKLFRIPYSEVFAIKEPSTETSEIQKKKFKELLGKHMVDSERTASSPAFQVTKRDLLHHKDRTCKFLKLRESLETHSKDSNLIVMTLPVIRKGACPAPLYMAWIDILSQNLPPLLYVRGNQEDVLTCYL